MSKTHITVSFDPLLNARQKNVLQGTTNNAQVAGVRAMNRKHTYVNHKAVGVDICGAISINQWGVKVDEHL